ncbi:MAG TPA: serine hydrolase domain-containing protein [Chitinophagaceae bacterium]|nr:serine hydrolase domain-containing protein [Chitinophagaceae bacterium]
MKTAILFVTCFLYSLKTCNYGGQTAGVESDSASYPVTQASLSATEVERYIRAVEDFYDSALDHPSFNGSFLVAKNGQVIFERYRGFADLGKKDSLTARHAFHIASISKTFTAMAVLKLFEEGRIQLSDSLGKFFPDFPYEGVTVKMLLSHRSGLPNYAYYLEEHKWDKKIRVTNNDVLQTLYTYRPALDFTPGKRFAYCNTNYVLLALIIEKITGMSYAQYLQSIFFGPLGMQDTYVYTLADSARAMPSYEYNGRKWGFDFLDLVYGDKNIYSTARDLLKWDQALYSTTLFKQSTLDSAFTPYSFEKPGVKNYGLGWRMFCYPTGKKIVYHNGWWHGNNTVLTRLVQDSATIIVLGNKRNNRIYRVKPLFEVFSHYNGQEELEQ